MPGVLFLVQIRQFLTPLSEAGVRPGAVANRPRFGCYSQLPTEAYWGVYWGLLGPIDASVISVSIYGYLFLACYLPATASERNCVLKSLITSGYDRTISGASTTYAYTYLFA